MIQAESVDARPKATPAAARPLGGVGAFITLLMALSAAIALGRGLDVWRTGAFFDTDDAMRMTQVRDWLAGQGYFDLVAHRMDPPAGVLMHWSRIVDMPLAALMKIFGLFAAPATAEALTRLAFPALMLAALYGAVAWSARVFSLRLAPALAVALTFLGAPYFAQFAAGRVDHHAPQIVLLVLIVGATMAGFARESGPRHQFQTSVARLGATAGALSALSLSISLENLPFLAVLAAAPALAWIIEGARQRRFLVAYALGLFVGLVAFYGATVPATRMLSVACDALSFAHVAAGLTGALGLLALGALTPLTTHIALRAAAACLFGLAPLAVVKLVAPQCLGDPFVGLDPIVRAIWLTNVSEVHTLRALFSASPYTALALALPTAIGALAALVFAFTQRGAARARGLLLAALIAIGLAMTGWGVRVLTSIAPLIALAGAAFVGQTLARTRLQGVARGALTILALLPFAPLAYVILLPADAVLLEKGSLACLRPETMRSLDRAPAGLVLAPVSAGSHLLALTRHGAIAAPYHRNNHGDRLSIDIFSATPAEAEHILRDSGATYLLACPHIAETRLIADTHPGSLAAALIAQKAPGWLEKVDGIEAPNTLYRLRAR